MIKISGLEKSYGEKKVIKDMHLTIDEGSIFGLVGINGAGKSTLLRLMAGVLKPDLGILSIEDVNIFNNDTIKKKVFFLPDDPMHNNLTTGKSLKMLYQTFYPFDDALFKSFLTIFNLSEEAPIHNFSKGMRRQLYVALALAVRPKYLLLDEAFDGLDPKARLIFKRALIKLVEEENTTVVISSHSLRELEDICDSFGLLEDGYFKSSGKITEELDRMNKYQLAFKEMIDVKMFEDLDTIDLKVTGRVARIVMRGQIDDVKEILGKYQPIFIETIPIDFEELFIYEVERREKNESIY